MTTPSIAGRLRAIHDDPTVAHLDELLVLAVQVEKYERQLDEIFQQSRPRVIEFPRRRQGERP